MRDDDMKDVNILFISSSSEKYYFEPFTKKSENTAANFYLFDMSLAIFDGAICLELDRSGGLSGRITVQRVINGKLVNQCLEIDINDIDLAWYIRPNKPKSAIYHTKIENDFATAEINGLMAALCSTAPWKWVNHEKNIKFFESNKLVQQIYASKVGLITPFTLASNKGEDAKRVAASFGDVLVKPFKGNFIGHEQLLMYSQKISQDDLSQHAEGIGPCPVYLQEYIDKKFEYRITICFESILTCRIDSQSSSKTKIDWRRYDFENVSHTQAELPKDIVLKLLDFMKAINLNFGAIDMIETPDKEFIFLEINPSGQYGWIEDLSGLPISETVRDQLIKMSQESESI